MTHATHEHDMVCMRIDEHGVVHTTILSGSDAVLRWIKLCSRVFPHHKLFVEGHEVERKLDE